VRRLLQTDGEVLLSGWAQGEGEDAPVLLLHGGPGLSADYLDAVADEIEGSGAVAGYQQRGLAPSRLEGPFTIADHCADACRVLDALGWDRAVVVGHSWGGHLALHLAVAAPERVAAVLAVDPLGAVGDGGWQDFETEMFRRTPQDVRQRAQELDEMAMRGEGTEHDALESLRLVWPAYFPSWEAAPEMPSIRLTVAGYAETLASALEELPRLEAALPSIAVPVGFLIGAASPMPATASTDTAERIPGAWVDVVAGAGHFPWMDAPGCVRTALERLTR
jgi:pimeloyl-ACP methyl ester carboxylesterase